MDFAGTTIRVQFAFEPSEGSSDGGVVRWARIDPITGKPSNMVGEFTFGHEGGTSAMGPSGKTFITNKTDQYFLGAHILRSSVVKPATKG